MAGLDLLRAVGWMVLHDVAVPGDVEVTIDHVLAGPSGVYTINTIGGSGAIRMDESSLYVGGASQLAHVEDVASAALVLREVLGGQPVVPILCFQRADEVAGVVANVAVCSTENILELLNGQPQMLDAATANKVIRTLNATLERQTAGPRTLHLADPSDEASPKHRDRLKPRKRLLGFGRPAAGPAPVELSVVAPLEPQVDARAEVARLEAARLEAERLAAEEAARVEAELVEAERLAAEEAARQEAEEAARVEAERQVAEEAARVEAEEAARVEAERVAAEEAARVEAERLAAEEAARLEAEEAARVEAERLSAEEVARLEAEEAARVEAERLVAEEAARVEAERLAAEEAARVEAERLAAEEAARVEAERLAAEEAARVEAERLAAEEAARVEAERLAAEEAARVEAERVAAEEAARAARVEAERLEAERHAAETAARAEAALVEAERLAAAAAAAKEKVERPRPTPARVKRVVEPAPVEEQDTDLQAPTDQEEPEIVEQPAGDVAQVARQTRGRDSDDPVWRPIGPAAKRVDVKSAIKMVSAAFARRDEEPEFDLEEIETAFRDEEPAPRALPAWFGGQPPVAPAKPATTDEPPTKKRRHSLLPAVLAAVVVALIFGVAPRVPDAYAWGRSFFVAAPPPSLGQSTVIPATGAHPALRMTAGKPVDVRSANGVSAGRGKHLVAIPIRATSAAKYTLPIATSIKLVDSLGITHVPATKVTRVTTGRVLPKRLALSPSGTSVGLVVFAIENGRDVRSVSVSLDAFSDPTTWKSVRTGS